MEDNKCTCPDDQCLLGAHPTCRWKGFVEVREPECEKPITADRVEKETQEQLWKSFLEIYLPDEYYEDIRKRIIAGAKRTGYILTRR